MIYREVQRGTLLFNCAGLPNLVVDAGVVRWLRRRFREAYFLNTGDASSSLATSEIGAVRGREANWPLSFFRCCAVSEPESIRVYTLDLLPLGSSLSSNRKPFGSSRSSSENVPESSSDRAASDQGAAPKRTRRRLLSPRCINRPSIPAARSA